MFNFTPPSRKNVAKLCGIILIAFLFFTVYMRGYQAGTSGADWASTCDAGAPKPVAIRKSIFLNPDSIAFYSAIAAREDTPRALFVAGMAAFIAQKDLPTGKKTMKAYLWKVCGDEYDQLHQG